MFSAVKVHQQILPERTLSDLGILDLACLVSFVTAWVMLIEELIPENFETRGRSAWRHLRMWFLMDHSDHMLHLKPVVHSCWSYYPHSYEYPLPWASSFTARVYNLCYMDTGAGVGIRLGCRCPIRQILRNRIRGFVKYIFCF